MSSLIKHYRDDHGINFVHKGPRGPYGAKLKKEKALAVLGSTYQTAASRITALQKETRDSVEALKTERDNKNAALNDLINQRTREVSELDAMIKRYESLLLAQ